MTPPTWIVIPAKPLQHAKQRLSDVLSPRERGELAREMLLVVLDRALSVAEATGVLVVTPDRDLARACQTQGAECLVEERVRGHACAIMRAVRHLSLGSPTGVLAIPGDVPLVDSRELSVLTRSIRAGSLAIVPNHAGEGTNALGFWSADPISFQFGPGSLERHAASARRNALRVRILKLAGLLRDIDTPENLTAWQAAVRERGLQTSASLAPQVLGGQKA